jgi:hypothetical protein
LTEKLSELPIADLQNLAKQLKALEKDAPERGPQTNEELHAWIEKHLGMSIPTTAVCEGHCSPFDFVADIYFERTSSALAMANRGGGKTENSAILHLLNSLFRPGCESGTVGALLLQANRAYDVFKSVLKLHGNVSNEEDHPDIVRSIQDISEFKNGSEVRIIPGTVAAVNGPHWQKFHTDELDLMDGKVFQESRQIPMSKPGVKKTQWITSTRKSATGPMQKLINSITDAMKEGHKPPYKLYTWCVFETAENVSNCQVANPDLADCDKCDCHTVAKGKWDDGTTRTFDQICGGKFARSEGYIPLEDIQETFMSSDLDTWEAQQECSKPEVGGMVFRTWSRERYGIKWYDPDPSNGLIFMGVDFSGGAVPNAVTWYQLLRNDVLVHAHDDEKGKPTKILKAGTRVAFDEIYKANIGNTQLADLVVEREKKWRREHEGFRVARRFPDPANKQARHDWAYHNPPLATVFYCTRDIKEQIKTCKQIMRDDQFAVDLIRCEMMQHEFDAYHYPEKKDQFIDDPEIPIDDFNHTMSNFRYTMENLKHIEKKIQIKPGVPGSGQSPHTTKSPVKSSTPRYHNVAGV